MKSNTLLILGPVIVLADLLAVSPVSTMLGAEDKAQVMVATILGCLLLSINFILIRTLFLKTRK